MRYFFESGYPCQHGHTGLAAEPVLRLYDDLHAVDFPNRLIKAVGTVLVHTDQRACHMEQDPGREIM